jgi:hypothetical protein
VAILLRRRIVALLSTLVLLIAASVAIASPADVTKDLDDGIIQRCHSVADYDEALRQLPPTDPQYSSDADTIADGKINHVCGGVKPSSGDDSNTAGYVVWGVVGGAIAIAAALGSVLARKSRRDDAPDA